MIRATIILGLLAFSLSGWVQAASEQSSTSSKTTQSLAVAWCEKRGGKVFAIKSANVNVANITNKNNNKCLLPTGELIEIWALYKRDHK
ncbi:hypothetical protein RBA64_16760 [Brenneria goodwinii]